MEHYTANIQTASDYSSAITIMIVISGLNVISALFLIARFHSKTNLKTYEQTKNFFDLGNTHSSSEESLKKKRHTFIGICSLFTLFNKQILNLCHR